MISRVSIVFSVVSGGVRATAHAILALLVLSSAAPAQTILWTKNHGGTQSDGAYDVTETTDGGFIVAGFKSRANYLQDFHLLRTNSGGDMIWSRTFPGPLNGWGSEVLELPDGGFIAAGVIEVNPQTFDSYVVRTDENGNLLWARQYDAGIGDDDRAHAIFLTEDGGFIIAGQAWWPEPPFGSYDVYVVKCDALGNREWTNRYKWAPEGADVALAVAQMSDGGFLIGGFTQAGTWDAYVIRTDTLGNVQWQRTYGGDWGDEAYDLKLTADGGFVLTGAFISNAQTDTDIGLVKANAAGDVEWERVYGGNDAEWGQQVWPTSDGGYLIAGHTASYGMGSWDGYVLRTDPNGTLLWTQIFGGESDDRGFAVEQTRDGDAIVAGWAWSFGAGMGDVYLLKIDDGATVNVAEGGAPGAEAIADLRVAPTPFRGSTQLEISIPSSRRAALRIFDPAGRVVRTLFDGEMGAGHRSIAWDGRDAVGRPVASGIYFGSLLVDGRAVTRKVIRLP
jgi:hypothetical protein